MKRLIAILCAAALIFGMLPVISFAVESGEFVVLSTTDMHGKCWDTNVLTDGKENNNMLKVKTAVNQYRQTYGAENVLVIDNGDLYQGTPVSSVQINKYSAGESDLPLAMALCLADIGYTAAGIGNHEFNYPWKTMEDARAYLLANGVSSICANLYYEATGENVFTPYIVKEMTLGEKTYRIGILGLESTDCPRWDVPDNYPGILFHHPDNTACSIAWEANRYIPMMKEEGCDFIIAVYHGGAGSTTGELIYGQNTESQASRLIAETEGIDLVIAGHDHSTGYSNTYINNKNGEPVLIVNGGGTQLTKSVFSVTVEGDKVSFAVASTENVGLSSFASDEQLTEKIRPYAEMASAYVNQEAGKTIGTWDSITNYYLMQSNSMDLIQAAQMFEGTKYLAQKYDTPEKLEALYAETGLDHIDVDMSSTSVVVNGSYYVRPGSMSMKDIYRLYKYDNNLYLLPLTGAQIKAILEQNASTRLKAVVKNGSVSYSTVGEDFTNPVFGGLNFTYDMAQSEGSRVIIEGFSNGRAFELEKTYIVGVNNYHLGNNGCGFGAYSTSDAIWSQTNDLGGGVVQDLIMEFLSDKTASDGGVDPSTFNWSWKLDYTGDLDAPQTLDGEVVAVHVDEVKDGDRILIYYSAESTVLSSVPSGNRISAEEATMVGDYISTSAQAGVYTVEITDAEAGQFALKSADGTYLTAGETGNALTYEEELTDCAKWHLVAVEGGFHIMNDGANYNGNYNQALEYYNGFTTYGVKDAPAFLFNLYQVVETAAPVSELENGSSYVIFFDADALCVSSNPSGQKLDSVVNTHVGGRIILPLVDGTLVVTANIDEAGRIDFVTADGKHLTAGETGNALSLTEEAQGDLSLWTLVPVDGGFHVMSVGAAYNGNHNQALEYYNGFTTYGVKDNSAFLFNFYQVTTPDTPEDPCQDGHSWDEGKITTQPTCIETGIQTYTCTVCDETKTETVDALGHKEVTDAATAPTCTEAGKTEGKHCERCGEVLVAQTDIDPLGHIWDKGVIITMPTETEDGIITYTCKVCKQTRTESIPKLPFTDVHEADYYYEPVVWAVVHERVNGVSATRFAPNSPCTRAQVVTMLWRGAECPEPVMTKNPFTDIKESDYFYKAVLWAVQQGITKGVSETRFAPNSPCTRAQLVTFLYRTCDVGIVEDTCTFTDLEPDAYYVKAVKWAYYAGITTGLTETKFGPENICTRGQLVTFIYRSTLYRPV